MNNLIKEGFFEKQQFENTVFSGRCVFSECVFKGCIFIDVEDDNQPKTPHPQSSLGDFIDCSFNDCTILTYGSILYRCQFVKCRIAMGAGFLCCNISDCKISNPNCTFIRCRVVMSLWTSEELRQPHRKLDEFSYCEVKFCSIPGGKSYSKDDIKTSWVAHPGWKF